MLAGSADIAGVTDFFWREALDDWVANSFLASVYHAVNDQGDVLFSLFVNAVDGTLAPLPSYSGAGHETDLWLGFTLRIFFIFYTLLEAFTSEDLQMIDLYSPRTHPYKRRPIGPKISILNSSASGHFDLLGIFRIACSGAAESVYKLTVAIHTASRCRAVWPSGCVC
jgi:hypothetical protein